MGDEIAGAGSSEDPAEITIVDERGTGKGKRRELSAPEDAVAGWQFPVPVLPFASALDVTRDDRVYIQTLSDKTKKRVVRKVWTQSEPPVYAFAVGDLFYSPLIPAAPWGEQVNRLQWHLQVLSVKGDEVTVEIGHYPERRTERRTTSQTGVADLLRHGAR